MVYVIQFSCMLKKQRFSKKNDPKRHPETMQKASHIFKVQQCHFPNHILRTFHSDPRLRSMSNYFSFFCFASRRKLALPCPGHINRVPNCGEMVPSFKTQSHNFFSNSLHLALKLACLRVGRTPKTGGPARPSQFPARSSPRPKFEKPGPAHGPMGESRF